MSEVTPGAAVQRLAEVMTTLRRECPWDAEQTHLSLVTHLVEETAEVVDAIEDASTTDLREELGDLLLQVVFHAEIEREGGGFDLADVAGDIADKLVRRHPHVFAGADVPDDLTGSWEVRKRAEKQRTSALDGIARSLDTLARAQKVLSRSHSHGVRVEPPCRAPDATVGEQILALVQQAQREGVDADQSTRDALRAFEAAVRCAEADATPAPDAP